MTEEKENTLKRQADEEEVREGRKVGRYREEEGEVKPVRKAEEKVEVKAGGSTMVETIVKRDYLKGIKIPRLRGKAEKQDVREFEEKRGGSEASARLFANVPGNDEAMQKVQALQQENKELNQQKEELLEENAQRKQDAEGNRMLLNEVLQEKEEAQQKERDLQQEKEDLVQRIAELQNKNMALFVDVEVSKYRKENSDRDRKMVAELEEKVECPVCLVVPREGPVPCCPHGHITCSPCLGKLRAEGRQECPTCRVPIGEGRSALARIVIEHMDHQCSFQGCQVKVASKDYRRHQEDCEHRRVICPSSNFSCSKIMAFCEVEEHAITCRGVDQEEAMEVVSKCEIREDEMHTEQTLKWSSQVMKTKDGEVFFLRMNRIDDVFSLEVVMLGNEEECKRFSVEASIIDAITEEVACKSVFHPRPISSSNNTEICLNIKQAGFAKICKLDKVRKCYQFNIFIKIDED